MSGIPLLASTIKIYKDIECENLIREINMDTEVYDWGIDIPPKGTYYAIVTKVPESYIRPIGTIVFDLLGKSNEELIIELFTKPVLPSVGGSWDVSTSGESINYDTQVKLNFCHNKDMEMYTEDFSNQEIKLHIYKIADYDIIKNKYVLANGIDLEKIRGEDLTNCGTENYQDYYRKIVNTLVENMDNTIQPIKNLTLNGPDDEISAYVKKDGCYLVIVDNVETNLYTYRMAPLLIRVATEPYTEYLCKLLPDRKSVV